MAEHSSSRVDLEATVNVHSNIDNESDDAQQLETQPQPPKIDIIALKNEILTDGMQVSPWRVS